MRDIKETIVQTLSSKIIGKFNKTKAKQAIVAPDRFNNLKDKLLVFTFPKVFNT